MDFARPMGLLLLPVLTALGLVVARDRRRRQREWAALGRTGGPPRDGAWAWVGAAGLLIVALAGPRWGRADDDRPAGRDVVLLVDVSRSMAAQDAIPNRLGAAIEAGEAVLRSVGTEGGGRVGVVAFAGRGVLRCPLTENLGAVSDVLRGLRPGEVRPGGTDLAAGLSAAIEAFGPEAPKAGRSIVILSDGEDLGGAWEGPLSDLAESGVIVHAIAIGDDAPPGQPIPLPGGGTLTFEGREVRSRRDDAPLNALADRTGGAFLPLGLAQPGGLDRLFAERVHPAAQARYEASGPGDRIERYPAFVLGALGLGLAASWPRRRGVLVASLGLMLIVGAGPQGGPPPATSPEDLRVGNAAYALGRFDEALAAFDRASRREPASAVAAYDAAAVLYRLGRFEEAHARYLTARERAEAGLRTKIDYALGNTAFALGDIPAALGHYDACLASTVPGPAFDAIRRDAAINREFVARRSPPEEDAGDDPGDRPPRETTSPSPPEPDREPSEAEADPEAPKSTPASGPDPRRNPPSPKASASSPEARLDQALSQARDARRRRLTDEPPPEADPVRRDW
jgi:Ca-activated chloride channel family protein